MSPPAAAAIPENPAVLLRLTLPSDLVDHFEAQATLAGLSLETYLLDHLTRTRYFTDSAPIYIDDVGRAEIQRLLGAKTTTQSSLLDILRRLVSWKLGPHKIEMTPKQIEAIVQMARTIERPVAEVGPQFLRDMIAEKLKTR